MSTLFKVANPDVIKRFVTEVDQNSQDAFTQYSSGATSGAGGSYVEGQLNPIGAPFRAGGVQASGHGCLVGAPTDAGEISYAMRSASCHDQSSIIHTCSNLGSTVCW